MIGGSTTIGLLTIVGTGGVTLSGIGGAAAGVTGATSITSSTGITLNGGTYNANAQTYTGPAILGTNTTVTSNNSAVSFSSLINGTAGTETLDVEAGSSTVSIGGVIGGSTTLGSLTVVGNGGVTLNGIGNSVAVTTGVSGVTAITSTTGITLQGTAYYTNGATYTGPVILVAPP